MYLRVSSCLFILDVDVFLQVEAFLAPPLLISAFMRLLFFLQLVQYRP